MRLLALVLRSIVALVALLVLLYVVVNVGAVAAGTVQRHRVAEDVSDVLPRIVPSAEQAQADLVASAAREPDRRWIEQDCRYDHDDGGWMVVNWREVCVLRSVTAWRVASEREARALVPVRGEETPGYDGCLPLGVAGDLGVVEGEEATFVDPQASAGEPWCLVELDPSDGGRAVRGDRADLGGGRWLVLVAEQPLVDEDIGCAHWSVLFCDNPWFRHAYGDWP